MNKTPTKLTKLKWSLPWLTRYPFWRVREIVHRFSNGKYPQNLVFVIANHYEPSWLEDALADLKTQIVRVKAWHEKAKKIASALKDSDGYSFRHTYFFPIEQYYKEILDSLSETQADDLGEVEIHLHHGVEKPDTSENLRSTLIEMRDTLAEKHKLLSWMESVEHPVYAFVHGNLALANSAGGEYCGVDNEMQILAETGCYADMTLPTAPDITQVPMLNAIYECRNALDEAIPHRSGNNLRVGQQEIDFPFIFTGPLVFNWTENTLGIPAPRLDNGVLAENQPMDLARLERWRSTRISVKGREDWVFIKLYCHGFLEYDTDSMIGERALRFFSEVIEHGERTGEYKVHFATAREACNMVIAAVEGKEGSPTEFRDYRLKSIMKDTNESVLKTTSRLAAASTFLESSV